MLLFDNVASKLYIDNIQYTMGETSRGCRIKRAAPFILFDYVGYPLKIIH